MADAVNLDAELAEVEEFWSPRVVGQVNDTALKVVRVKGEFGRHAHGDEDECFLVLDGELTIDFDDGPVTAGAGEFIIVPRGVPHAPHCDEEVRLLLIEPVATVQYGDAGEGAVMAARTTATS